MNTEVREISSITKRLAIQFEPQEVDQEYKQATAYFVKNADIPGFRPGKVPASVVQQKYKAQIQEQVFENLVNRGYQKGLEQHHLVPVSAPKLVQEDKLAAPMALPGFPLSLVLEFYVRPQITLGQYKGIAVKKQVLSVTDEDLKKQQDALRERMAELVPVEGRNTLQAEDHGEFIYDISIDGKPYTKDDNNEHTLIKVSEKELYVDFYNQILGMEVGATKEFDIDYPANYQNTDLAGKKTHFKVTLNQIKQLDLPVLDDEFARGYHFEDLEKMNAFMLETLKRTKEREIEQEINRQISDVLVNAHEFEVPPHFIEEEKKALIEQFKSNLKNQGFDEQSTNGSLLATIEKDAEAVALRNVKRSLILSEIADAEKLTVSHEEVHAKIHQIAAQSGQDEKRVHAYFANERREDSLKYEILEEKTMAFLRAQAQTEEVQ